FGQTRCGSLRSWQLGHSESERLFRASWARRVLVRCLECRRFGFGIVSSNSVVVCCEYLSALPIADPQPAPRTSTVPGSNSCHNAGTTPCNLHDRLPSRAPPAAPARAAHLPKVDRTRAKLFLKINRMELQLMQFDEHGHLRAPTYMPRRTRKHAQRRKSPGSKLKNKEGAEGCQGDSPQGIGALACTLRQNPKLSQFRH